MDKKIIRPTNTQVSIFCKGCNTRDKSFMTLQEIFDNTKIKQPCNKCGKFTTWTLGGKDGKDNNK